MSGIFFDIPNVRFLRRFRFLQAMRQIFVASLLRWLSAPACGSRQGDFRHTEAEFPSASQRRKFDWTLDDSRAADGVPNLFGALRPFNNWTKPKNQHELLFIRKTPTPLARWGPNAEEITNAFGASRERRQRRKKRHSGNGLPNFLETAGRKGRPRAAAQRRAAFATCAQARAD